MDVVLHVQRGDAVLEVGLHPVLHAGVGVHHEPVARLGAQRLAELLERVDRRASRRGLVGTRASSVEPSSASSVGGASRRRLDGGLVGGLDHRVGRRRARPPTSAAARRPGSSTDAGSTESVSSTVGSAGGGLGGRLVVVRLRHGCQSPSLLLLWVCLWVVLAVRAPGQAKTAKTSLPKPRSSSDTNDITTTTNTRTTMKYVISCCLRGPHDLAELGHDLPVEGGRAGALVARLAPARRRHRTAVRHCSSTHLLVVTDLGPHTDGPHGSAQGTRDLNPQPSVLETDALPVELVPSGGST